MSDVEMMCTRNWEQRRHAEEYDAAQRDEPMRWEHEVYEDFGGVKAEDLERKTKYRKRCRAVRLARDAGRVALGMSMVSALVGLELLWPLFLLIAVLFYAVKFELEGDETVWTGIFT